MRGRLGVVIPCLNEQESVAPVLTRTNKVLYQMRDRGLISDFHIIVVNDGSTDATLRELSQFPSVQVISHPENLGYGRSLHTGLKRQATDYLAIYDMDATYPPEELHKLVQPVVSGEVRGAVGTRLQKASGMSMLRWFGNSFFKYTIWLLYGRTVSDPCSGMWVIEGSLYHELKDLLPTRLNFTLALTLNLLRKNVAFKEIEITYGKRTGESKLSVLSDGLNFLNTILQSRLGYK